MVVYLCGAGPDRVAAEPPENPADLRAVVRTSVANISDDPAVLGYLQMRRRADGIWEVDLLEQVGRDTTSRDRFSAWCARVVKQTLDIGPHAAGLFPSERDPGSWFAHCRLVDGPDMSFLERVVIDGVA